MSDASPAVELRVKAVPGASRDAIAGALGDRLKVRVSAPPEGGRANRAIITLIARELGVSASQIDLVAGATSPTKTLRITGVDADLVRALMDR